MAKDFSSDQGAIQGVGPNTAGPRESGTPKVGFSEAPKSKGVDTAAGEGIPPNSKRIH